MLSDLLIPHWFWLCLGGILLALEMLGTAGYLLWSGIAAVCVGILSYLFPLSAYGQVIFFALLTLLSAFTWWYYLRGKQREHPSYVNQRGQQLIGLRTTLDEAIVNGVGRIRLGDGSWRVTAQQDLPAGQNVIITGVDGNTLLVSAVTPSSSSHSS